MCEVHVVMEGHPSVLRELKLLLCPRFLRLPPQWKRALDGQPPKLGLAHRRTSLEAGDDV